MGVCLGECEEQTASHISRELMRPMWHGENAVIERESRGRGEVRGGLVL